MLHNIKTGVYLPNYGPFGDARAVADLARDAESAGWDGFFLWDHIAPYNDDFGGGPLICVDPWLALTPPQCRLHLLCLVRLSLRCRAAALTSLLGKL